MSPTEIVRFEKAKPAMSVNTRFGITVGAGLDVGVELVVTGAPITKALNEWITRSPELLINFKSPKNSPPDL